MAQTETSSLERTGSAGRTRRVDSPPRGRGNSTGAPTGSSNGQGRQASVQDGARKPRSADTTTSPAKRTGSAGRTRKVSSPARGRSNSARAGTSTGSRERGGRQGGAGTPQRAYATSVGGIRQLAVTGLAALAGALGGVVLDRWNHSHSRRVIRGRSRSGRWARSALDSALPRAKRVRRGLGR
jgi:hypothetical protein